MEFPWEFLAIFCQEVRRGEIAISERFRSILVLNWWFFFWGTILKPRISPLISTHPKGSSSHTTLDPINPPGLAWDKSAVCPDFSDKDSKWMGHDLSNAQSPKAPRGSLVDTLQFQNDTTKIYKEACSKQSMAGCSWFQTVSSILVAPFSQKNLSSLLFRCFLPAAGRGI